MIIRALIGDIIMRDLSARDLIMKELVVKTWLWSLERNYVHTVSELR